MFDLSELYQETLLEHSRKPHNFRKLAGANRSAEGYNPLCGDRITLFLKLDGDVVREASFQGSGCAISKASASLLTESVKGKTTAEVEGLFKAVRQMLTRDPGTPFDDETLGDLAVLSGVSEYPTRVKCAALSWHTLHAALEEESKPVSTE